MSVKVMGRVWDLDLPHSQQSVLLALADHSDHDGGSVYPSTGRIAWKTGYSHRQVQRIIDSLELAKLLVKVANARDHRPTEYRIDLAAGKPKQPYRGDKLSSRPKHWDRGPQADGMSPRGVTSEPNRGDIAVSPKPSIEPSTQPSPTLGQTLGRARNVERIVDDGGMSELGETIAASPTPEGWRRRASRGSAGASSPT